MSKEITNVDLLLEFTKALKMRGNLKPDELITETQAEIFVRKFLGEFLGDTESAEEAEHLQESLEALESEKEAKVIAQIEEQRKWDLARRGFIQR